MDNTSACDNRSNWGGCIISSMEYCLVRLGCRPISYSNLYGHHSGFHSTCVLLL
ncbi:probable amino acid permease 7 [Phtheirospermum japonicum]|uniref:Probable amino acid permease 7 n=1 Tax=Phtheirospermum japonicum TaxID=374723 RepID=A0A830DE89_9LAMI|nr:probable amino acid permease 7 [Phtheirospermum japonicum]